MLNAIAQNNIFRTDYRIVSGGLLEGFSGKFNVGRLAFHKNFRLRFFGYQKVDAFRKAVQFHFFFGDKCGCGIAFCCHKILYPVLANPFFGCEQEPGFPGQIINKKFIFVFPEFKIKSFREIQFRKFHQL